MYGTNRKEHEGNEYQEQEQSHKQQKRIEKNSGVGENVS